jgi:hypothetical protein
VSGEIIKQSLEDWQRDLFAIAGDPPPDWSRVGFECPRCGNVATAQQFVDLGEPPDRAATNCIGRFLNAEGDPGCDWAAYGLLGILNGPGRILTKPDGDTVQVFEFAEVPS